MGMSNNGNIIQPDALSPGNIIDNSLPSVDDTRTPAEKARDAATKARLAAYGLTAAGTKKPVAFTAPLEPSATDKLLQKASDPMKWLTQARNSGRGKSFLGGDAMGAPAGSSSILGSK